jgi:hypothetical protein
VENSEVIRLRRVREEMDKQFATLDEMFAFFKKLEKKRKRNIEWGRRSLAQRAAERRREAQAGERRERKATLARRSA